MILIITGLQGTGKTTIARMLALSADCKLYDEIPAEEPADLPKDGLVVMTTNGVIPEWLLRDKVFSVLKTIDP